MKGLFFVFLIQVNSVFAISYYDQDKNVFVKSRNSQGIENRDSLDFVLFFRNLIEDETLRERSFETCDSNLKSVLNRRLDQLEESIVFRNELTNSDSLVSVLFYDDSVKFYKGKFLRRYESWNLISLEKIENPNVPVLKELRVEKNRIKYYPGCIDRKFIGIIDNYGEIDTVRNGKQLLKYAFSNSYMFYSENRNLLPDFSYRILGLGSGVNGLVLFKDGCLFHYWDASN